MQSHKITNRRFNLTDQYPDTVTNITEANYTDKQIDKLVYELYDLTEEEIKIVEGD